MHQRFEQQQAFEAEAERRRILFLETGEYLALEDLRGYALALARGAKAVWPALRRLPPEELALIRASAGRAAPPDDVS